jgi:7,8-dihydropterin-6-yl-methyl-4-(beta-D-ribofuranosyl)aminobenzene 5'-phosphate synthase
MKLTVLTENCASGKFLAEHGLSYFIEHEDKKVLFDTGHTDVFLKNAERLQIDIQKETDTVVLSHGHWDHGNGLQYLSDKILITHPNSFIKRFRKEEKNNIGLALNKEELKAKFRLEITSKPFQISENIIFLGEIPRNNNFEAKTTSFTDEHDSPDFIPDDSALAIIQEKQLHIITGCSHSGICNIVDYAQNITGIDTIKTVIGGFHLKHDNEQTQKTIQFLKSKQIENIYPSHCTQLEALIAFSRNFKIQQVKSGMVFNF